jgi:hypothetical protein
VGEGARISKVQDGRVCERCRRLIRFRFVVELAGGRSSTVATFKRDRHVSSRDIATRYLAAIKLDIDTPSLESAWRDLEAGWRVPCDPASGVESLRLRSRGSNRDDKSCPRATNSRRVRTTATTKASEREIYRVTAMSRPRASAPSRAVQRRTLGGHLN